MSNQMEKNNHGDQVTEWQLWSLQNKAAIFLTISEIEALKKYNAEFYANRRVRDPYSIFEDFPHHLVRKEISQCIEDHRRELWIEATNR